MAIGKREVEGTPVGFSTSSAQKRDRLPLFMLHQLDGRGAGAGVQLGIWEEEMSLVTRYPVLPQQVRVTTCLIGWGMGKGKDAEDLQEISPEWERTSPGVSGLEKPGSIPVHWLMFGREGPSGTLSWAKTNGKSTPSSTREEAVRNQ